MIAGIVASERIVVKKTVRLANELSPPYSVQRIGEIEADGIAATTVSKPSISVSFTNKRNRKNTNSGAISSFTPQTR